MNFSLAVAAGVAGLCLCGGAAAANRPLVVGISDQHRMADETSVEDSYARAVQRMGHVPLVIPCTTNQTVIEETVLRLDVLLLTGGADVDPSRYRAQRSAACGPADPLRDAFDFALVGAARRRRLPIVGICRGCQVMNVAFGGTLWQDLPSDFPKSAVRHGTGSYVHPEKFPPAHTVRFEPGTRLARLVGTNELSVNSHHHQAARDLAPGFRVTARAPDGVIEAIESTDYPAVGVQFHPETLVVHAEHAAGYDYPRLQALFRALLQQVVSGDSGRGLEGADLESHRPAHLRLRGGDNQLSRGEDGRCGRPCRRCGCADTSWWGQCRIANNSPK